MSIWPAFHQGCLFKMTVVGHRLTDAEVICVCLSRLSVGGYSELIDIF